MNSLSVTEGHDYHLDPECLSLYREEIEKIQNAVLRKNTKGSPSIPQTPTINSIKYEELTKEMKASKEAATREDLEKFQQEIVDEFRVVSEGLIDQINLLAEGHAGILHRLDRMEKENERQHQWSGTFMKL